MDVVDLESIGAGREQGAIGPGIPVPLAEAVGARVVALPQRPRFGVIDGGRRADAEPAAKMWLCNDCETDIGVATSVVEPVWQGPLNSGGRVRLSSGTKRLVCTHCKMRGKLTFVD
jgi:hypothetical protein